MTRPRFLACLTLLAAGVLSGSLFVDVYKHRADAPSQSQFANRTAGVPPASSERAVKNAVPISSSSRETPARSFASAAAAPADLAAELLAWQALPDDSAKMELAIGLGFELASLDPLAAIARVTALPESVARAWLLAGVVQTWAAREPHAAAAWAAALSDERLRAQVAGSVVLAWSSVDPAAATQWAANLPGERAAPALQRGITQWTGGDPDVAGRWVAALPPGATRDRAAAAHVEVLLIENPRAAAVWIDSLPAVEQPLPLIETVARAWLAINPAAARAWLERTSLPPDRRQRLIAAATAEVAGNP